MNILSVTGSELLDTIGQIAVAAIGVLGVVRWNRRGKGKDDEVKDAPVLSPESVSLAENYQVLVNQGVEQLGTCLERLKDSNKQLDDARDVILSLRTAGLEAKGIMEGQSARLKQQEIELDELRSQK